MPNVPVSEALGSSFKDLGGAGDQPANLVQGLAANGVSQTAHTPSAGPDAGFDAVLKAPAAAPAVSPFKLG
jgi:hypothetical protein